LKICVINNMVHFIHFKNNYLFMDKNSRRTVYAGVNYVFAPPVSVKGDARFALQKYLDDSDIQITDTKDEQNKYILTRKTQMPLEMQILLAPQIGQLLILAPELGTRSLEYFTKEADEIASIFERIWGKRQIIACDATIRDLYGSSSEHAFQELWEERLQQPSSSLQPFGRPVLGGGLRFVMPPTSNSPHTPLIEVKIESFLPDTKKIFLEVQCLWQQPQSPDKSLDPGLKLHFVDDYLMNEVIRFIMMEQ